jgi:MarR family transcriptional regulator, organic hydroperoxide resistance regulator
VFGALHKTMHSQRRFMAQKMARHGLAPAQAFAVRALGHGDGATQSELAERLDVSRPTVTVMIQKMEKAGLVERHADAEDQRYTRIYLTEAGWEIHEAVHDDLDDFIAHGIGSLAKKDQAELARLLGLLNDNLTALCDEGSATDKTEGETTR